MPLCVLCSVAWCAAAADAAADAAAADATRHPMPAIIAGDAHTWPAQIGGTERLLATATARRRNQ